ncbi:MAG: fimbrillin family protein [Roseburia sp.]|nr:fimbrillin family protein [Roseburia sp.]
MSASCVNGSDEDIVATPNGAVMLMVNPDVKSRMSTDGYATTFESGDRIKVSSAGLIDNMDGAILVVDGDGKTLNPEGSKKYYYNGNAEARFYACYPKTAVFSGTQSVTFTVASDQTDEGAHVANDFMTAQCTGTAASKPTLSFAHMLAWVKVEIENSNENAITGITVKDILPTATHTFGGTESIADFQANGGIDVKMGRKDDGFGALIPQQEIKAGKDLLDITIGDLTYTYAPTANITFGAGKVKTIKLKISNSVVMEAGISVADWSEEEEIEGNIFKKQE